MFKIVCLLLVVWASYGQNCDNNTCICTNNVCTSCVSAFMVMGEGSCMPCPATCTSCSSSTACSTCQLNYYLNNSSCLLCNQYCLSCTSYSLCTQCMVPLFRFRPATRLPQIPVSHVPSPTLSPAMGQASSFLVLLAIGKTAIVVPPVGSFAWCAAVHPTVCSARRASMWRLVLAVTAKPARWAVRSAPAVDAANAGTTIS
jgi:hypothetical protein